MPIFAENNPRDAGGRPRPGRIRPFGTAAVRRRKTTNTRQMEILIILLLILLNGLFAMSEIAIVSARTSEPRNADAKQRQRVGAPRPR